MRRAEPRAEREPTFGERGTNGAPGNGAPGRDLAFDPRVLRHVLDVQEESLELADSIERVVDLMRRAVASTPGTGAGAILLVDGGEPNTVATFGSHDANGQSPREIEIAGLARRAIREREPVRQAGIAGGALVAVPLRSPHAIEGVVVATGELDPLARFLAHAGPAIARERARQVAMRARPALERGARSFERAEEILHGLAAREDTELLAHRIACAAAGRPGLGGISIWTFRPEDGAPVEIAFTRPANERAPTLPREARDASAFDAWIARLPRWCGCAWVSGVAVRRARPDAGDLLIAPLADDESETSGGFLLAEVLSPPDAQSAEDLPRWSAFARLALLQSSGRRRADSRVEELRAEKDHEAEVHRVKSRIIAAVSHELRTPLTSISAYAETLQKPTVAAHAETRERFLRIIHDESRRLTRIVDDILDLATLENGRLRIAMRRVDLARVLGDAVDVIRPIATDRGITIRFDEPPEIPAQGDPDLLEQLVVNLLENAVKFSESGGEVRVTATREPTSCRISVEDEGPGIPADQLDRVFEQFYQVDGSNTRRHGGAGLGLAICRSVALWHDGRIWVESAEGRGARFVVSLPRARATSGPDVADGAPEPNGSGETARRIVELLVEMVAELLSVDTVALFRKEAGGEELVVQAAIGFSELEIRAARERFTDGAPIRLGGETIGLLHASGKRDGGDFDEDDRRLLETLAERVALVLGKLRGEKDAGHVAKPLERAIRGVLDARRHLGSADRGHLVVALCERLGVSSDEAARIRYAALVRDVGMTRVPFGVTKKPAPLGPRERAVIERHPEEGARLLRPIELDPGVFDLVLAHHEEPAGSGYPRRVHGEAIPLGAKILAVVDAYEALCAGRPYRSAVGRDEALEELRRSAGRQFEPQVVEALADVVAHGAATRTKRARREASSTDTPSSRRGTS